MNTGPFGLLLAIAAGKPGKLMQKPANKFSVTRLQGIDFRFRSLTIGLPLFTGDGRG